MDPTEPVPVESSESSTTANHVYTGVYTHGHHHSVLRSHTSRTVENSAAYLIPFLTPGVNVLDIGAGEGAWRAPLLKLRPKLDYLAFDSSEYAVRRFGRSRNLHYARFGDFEYLRPCPPADLLVCSDVLHYLDTRELNRGLPGLADLCGGVAFIEMFAKEDAAIGDEDGFHARPARFYRRRLAEAGFVQIGSHGWLSPALAGHATALEHA